MLAYSTIPFINSR